MKKKISRLVSLLLAVLLLASVCLPVPAYAADVDLEVVVKGPYDAIDETATIFVGETLKFNVLLEPQVTDLLLAFEQAGLVDINENQLYASGVVEVTGVSAGTVKLNFEDRSGQLPLTAGTLTFTVKKGFPVTITQPAKGGRITPPGNTSGNYYVETGGTSPWFKAIPDAGYYFFSLILDGTSWGVDNVQYFSMDKPHTLTAIFKPNSHVVSVNGGIGSGNHDYDSVVTIEADPAPTGMHFKEWLTSDVTLANPSDALTSFTMPDNAVNLTAVYEANRHNVVVNGGSGSNLYSVGDTVSLTADPAAKGMRFKEWQTTGVTLTNPSSRSISFTMPDNAVTLTAVYEKRSTANPGTTNASLNIKSAAFDRNPGSAGYGNVSVTLSSGSYSLSGIRLKGALLTAGKDYTASGGNYTFTSGFLGGLPEGEHGIVFEMSGGTDPVLTVTVTDSTEVWSNPFTDVKAGDWFYEDVAYVHQNRILLGTNETVFSPEQPMTRGMVVTALGRMAGIDPSAYTGSTFGDVAENKYYAPYVLWAAEQGVVEGIGNNLFAPGKNITREDLCLMVCRYAQAMQWELPESRESAGFADEQNIHPYARDAVIALYEAGVINGKPGSRFDPQGTATRAETAAVFCRLSEVIQ